MTKANRIKIEVHAAIGHSSYENFLHTRIFYTLVTSSSEDRSCCHRVNDDSYEDRDFLFPYPPTKGADPLRFYSAVTPVAPDPFCSIGNVIISEIPGGGSFNFPSFVASIVS